MHDMALLFIICILYNAKSSLTSDCLATNAGPLAGSFENTFFFKGYLLIIIDWKTRGIIPFYSYYSFHHVSQFEIHSGKKSEKYIQGLRLMGQIA